MGQQVKQIATLIGGIYRYVCSTSGEQDVHIICSVLFCLEVLLHTTVECSKHANHNHDLPSYLLKVQDNCCAKHNLSS